MYIDSFMFGGGFEIMFTLIFITVFGLIIFTIIRGIGEWNKNNQSPSSKEYTLAFIDKDEPANLMLIGALSNWETDYIRPYSVINYRDLRQ